MDSRLNNDATEISEILKKALRQAHFMTAGGLF